jgi:hypothetical protein
MKTFLNKTIFLSLFSYFISVGLFSQQIGIGLANLATTSTTVQFDIVLRNTGPGTIGLGGCGGGLQYSAAIGGTIAIGNNTGFNVITNPPAADFPMLPNFGPNRNHTNTASVIRHIRWTHAPSPGVYQTLSSTSDMRLGRFILTSTTPWAQTPTLADFTLAPIASGYSSPQAVIVHNGSSVAQTLILGAGIAPLPIELVDFKAKAFGQVNVVEWTTESERNVSSFIVERSSDGKSNWIQVDKKEAKGSLNGRMSYSTVDKTPLLLSYYRMRSVDFDGKEQRSQVVSVQRNATGTTSIRSVFPSPTTDMVSIEFESMVEGEVTFRVTDLFGRIMKEQVVGTTVGSNLIPVDMTTFSSGTYLIQTIKGETLSTPTKVIKL